MGDQSDSPVKHTNFRANSNDDDDNDDGGGGGGDDDNDDDDGGGGGVDDDDDDALQLKYLTILCRRTRRDNRNCTCLDSASE